MLLHMRTTILLDDELYREAKKAAADQGCTFTQLVSDSLRWVLARREEGDEEREFDLPVWEGTGLRPGVDITNSAALLDILDGFDGPA